MDRHADPCDRSRYSAQNRSQKLKYKDTQNAEFRRSLRVYIKL